jgi:hypothetical protein
MKKIKLDLFVDDISEFGLKGTCENDDVLNSHVNWKNARTLTPIDDRNLVLGRRTLVEQLVAIQSYVEKDNITNYKISYSVEDVR